MNKVTTSSLGELSGHIAWAFDGTAAFETAASSFLLAGQTRGERLIFISDQPEPARWPRRLLDSGDLQLASLTEVYGPEVRAEEQRQTFATVLDEAVRQGYSGIRVAADNSSLVISSDQVPAWMAWEIVADAFMEEAPVTGLCGFDRRRLGPPFIRFLLGLHPTAVD